MCPPKTHMMKIDHQYDDIVRWAFGRYSGLDQGREGGALMV